VENPLENKHACSFLMVAVGAREQPPPLKMSACLFLRGVVGNGGGNKREGIKFSPFALK